jgi:hypothetical protein
MATPDQPQQWYRVASHKGSKMTGQRDSMSQEQQKLHYLREYHFVRIQLIGCMDMEQRQLLRQQKRDLEMILSKEAINA